MTCLAGHSVIGPKQHAAAAFLVQNLMSHPESESWFAQYLLLVLLRVRQPPPELRVPALHLADPLPHVGVLPVASLVRRPALLQLHPGLLMLNLRRAIKGQHLIFYEQTKGREGPIPS